jgi:hypothetical protein
MSVQTPLLTVVIDVLRAVNANVDRRAGCNEPGAERTETSIVSRWCG